MKGSLEQFIDKYCDLANVKRETLRPSKTPSLDEHNFADGDFTEKKASSHRWRLAYS